MISGKNRRWYLLGGLLLVIFVLAIFFRHEIVSGLMTAYRWVMDREQMERFVSGFGKGAPFVFMMIQVLQVILAPVPGEVTGLIGGYLFGWINGFVYSSIALAVGSWVNFGIGRALGRRFVRRWIQPKQLARFDRLANRQGIIVISILFLFPGFPKDYLCLFLGITAIPLKVFLLISSIGRMPGTLMLSLQGEFLFQENYAVFALVFAVTLVAAIWSVRNRDRIYKWMEKQRKSDGNR